VVGGQYCMQLRTPRIRAGSVVRLSAGACDLQESRQMRDKSRQIASTDVAGVRLR
jgi:hypothetical protein